MKEKNLTSTHINGVFAGNYTSVEAVPANKTICEVFYDGSHEAVFNGTEWIESLPTPEEIVEQENKNSPFVYNNKLEVDKKDDFSTWSTFFLNSVAEVNSWGDKSKILWKNNDGKLAIEELLTYTRYREGTGLLAKLFLKRGLKVRYYRENGSFVEFELPERIYNENERVDADKKSRSNILERVRKNTGAFIYKRCLIDGTPQLIEVQLIEAMKLFDSLQKQVTLYREEREHLPLVQALQAVQTNENLVQETLDYIINAVNIDYYGN
jgi:hypothetical protein